MEATNRKFRDIMAGKVNDQVYLRRFMETLLGMVKDPVHTWGLGAGAAPSEAAQR
eukprot:gene259-4365_t